MSTFGFSAGCKLGQKIFPSIFDTASRQGARDRGFADGTIFAIFAFVPKKVSLILVALFFAGLSSAQQPKGYPMYFEIHDGETVFYDTIDPIWVFPRGRGFRDGDWRKDYRMVYNFNKIYPYALTCRKMVAAVDSTIAADARKRSQRRAYINDVEKELLAIFGKDVRNMTISQGLLLMRLIDRECGESAFGIIKEYKNGFTANFWQLVARLFSQDLKTRYDPTGRDARTEELVRIWDSGEWNAFYYSVFWEYPEATRIKNTVLHSSVQKTK